MGNDDAKGLLIFGLSFGGCMLLYCIIGIIYLILKKDSPNKTDEMEDVEKKQENLIVTTIKLKSKTNILNDEKICKITSKKKTNYDSYDGTIEGSYNLSDTIPLTESISSSISDEKRKRKKRKRKEKTAEDKNIDIDDPSSNLDDLDKELDKERIV